LKITGIDLPAHKQIQLIIKLIDKICDCLSNSQYGSFIPLIKPAIKGWLINPPSSEVKLRNKLVSEIIEVIEKWL